MPREFRDLSPVFHFAASAGSESSQKLDENTQSCPEFLPTKPKLGAQEGKDQVRSWSLLMVRTATW